MKSTLQKNSQGFSLIELLVSAVAGVFVLSIAGSLFVYAEKRQITSQREAQINEVTNLVKMNFDDYNNCSRNVYNLSIDPTGATNTPIPSINYYIVSDPTAQYPANLTMSSNLITAGQPTQSLLVTDIHLEGRGVTTQSSATTNQQQNIAADLVLTFDPNNSGVVEQRRLPISLTAYAGNPAVIQSCNAGATLGTVSNASVCQVAGQVYNPATHSCGAPTSVATWYTQNDPYVATCPTGTIADPSVGTMLNRRCECTSPPGWVDPRPFVEGLSNGGKIMYYRPHYWLNSYTPNSCICIYDEPALGPVDGFKAQIACVAGSS